MLYHRFLKLNKTILVVAFVFFFQHVNAQLDTASLSVKLNQSKDKLGKNFVVLIYKDGKPLYKKESTEFNAKTQQPIGATSQWLTAALVLTYVQEGKLSLDDKVSKYLPIFSKYYKGFITVRHCLTHFTGIAGDKILERSKFGSLEEEVDDYASKKDIQTNAGTESKYSNIGFNILGRVLEVMTKKNFDRLMRDRILQPTGMKNTTFTNENYNDALNPSAGARSTANDLINFMTMLLNNGTINGKQVLTPASVALLHTVQVPSGSMKNVPPSLQGLDYGMGEWILKANSQGKASTVGVPSLQGTYPFIDLCRKYSCVIFTKDLSTEPKKDFYIDLKSFIDDGIPGGCN